MSWSLVVRAENQAITCALSWIQPDTRHLLVLPFLCHAFISLTGKAWQRTFERFMEAASQRLKTVALPASSSNLVAKDVSTIVPTNSTRIQFVVGALASWLAIDPLGVIMVTIDNQVQLLNALIDKSLEGTEYSRAMVTVLGRFFAGKRKQRARGLERAKGSITVFVDDDVFWQPLLL